MSALSLLQRLRWSDAALGQCALPRNYEIWYVYATGYNPGLNKIINETLARNGKLTEADLEQIHETYLSRFTPSNASTRSAPASSVKSKRSMTLSPARSTCRTYDNGLTEGIKKLAQGADAATDPPIIESLVKSTREMRRPTGRFRTGSPLRSRKSGISSRTSMRSAPKA